MEKSGNNFLKLLKSGRGLGNSFSANLRCLNFEMLGKAHPPEPAKILGSLVTNSSWVSRKVMGKLCDSLEKFLYTPCYIYAVHIHLLCAHKGIHSHALLPLLDQQTCHLKVLGLNPGKVSTHG